MRVIGFTRRMHVERINNVCENLFGNVDIRLVSDERLIFTNVEWWGEYFYTDYNQFNTLDIDLSNIDYEDIIRRCRFLRVKNPVEAYDLAYRALLAWCTILKKNKPDFVLNLPVDSFVTHTLYIASDILEVPSFTVQYSQFPGRVRFTRYGEPISDYTQSSRDEFDSFIEGMKKGFKPEYLSGVTKNYRALGFQRVAIDFFKRPAYFLYRVLSGDRDTFSFSGWKYQLRLMMSTPSRLLAIMRAERGVDFDRIPAGGAFFPLQFYPESTNDYWINDKSVIDHHFVTLELVDSLRKDMPIYIKEHPACYSKRNSQFINLLKKKENVFFVPTSINVGSVIEKSEVVIGYASTTLMESIIRNKKVIFLGESYFGSGGYPIVTDPLNVKDALNRLQEINPEKNSKDFVEGLYQFFSSCYQGNIGGYVPIGEKAKLRHEFGFSEEAKTFVKNYILNYGDR